MLSWGRQESAQEEQEPLSWVTVMARQVVLVLEQVQVLLLHQPCLEALERRQRTFHRRHRRRDDRRRHRHQLYLQHANENHDQTPER
jgi:hypothetical protein